MIDPELLPEETPAMPFWRRVNMAHARRAALVFLAAITGYGLYLLLTGDWQAVTAFWLGRRRLLFLAFALSACDILTDGFIWLCILRQLGIRPGIRRGLLIFLSGYAAHLMPVQLGRVFRATELTRLYPGTLGKATSAELVLLYFVVITAVSAFTGALLYPWFAPAAFMIPPAMVWAALFFSHAVFSRVSWLPLHLPEGYWRRPTTLGLAFAASIGWLLNGTILYLLFQDVSEDLRLYQTIMIMTSNLFVGVSSGLPGGLGITEGYIGAMMYWLKTPPEHLVVAVAAFRIITFWLWIPIGWVALTLNTAVFPAKQTNSTDSEITP